MLANFIEPFVAKLQAKHAEADLIHAKQIANKKFTGKVQPAVPVPVTLPLMAFKACHQMMWFKQRWFRRLVELDIEKLLE